MVEVRLHGPLALHFGKMWTLDIRTPREAIAAIAVTHPGIRAFIMKLHRQGLVFRVRARQVQPSQVQPSQAQPHHAPRHHDYDNDDVGLPLGAMQRLDVVPIVRGANASVRFVAGAVLVVAGVWFQNPYLISAGVSLMLGSVVEWLTPLPENNRDSAQGAQSWTYQGPTNTAEQGLPVPVIYGEVLTGGVAVSAGISVSRLAVVQEYEPSAALSGDVETLITTGGQPNVTVRLRFAMTCRHLHHVHDVAWQLTGFPKAKRWRLLNPQVHPQGQPGSHEPSGESALGQDVLVELVYEGLPPGEFVMELGALSVSAKGEFKPMAGMGRDTGLAAQVSATASASLTLNTFAVGS